MEEIKELEIGEYVRTKIGFIGKIVNENIDAYLLDKRIRPYGDAIRDYCIFKDEINSHGIVKHSKDIKDLIQAGDILEVYFPIREITRKIVVDEYFKDSMILNGLINGNIILKLILTKEKFESECYEVEEK